MLQVGIYLLTCRFWTAEGTIKVAVARQSFYPGIQFKFPCTPRTLTHGCQIVHWDLLNAKQSCPQKNFGMGFVKYMVSMATPYMVIENGGSLQIQSYLGFN